MDLYLFALLLGFCGLAVMAIGGALSHGGQHSGGHHGHGHDVGDVSLHGHGAHAGHLHAGAHDVSVGHHVGDVGHHAGLHGHDVGHGHHVGGHGHDVGHGHGVGHGHHHDGFDHHHQLQHGAGKTAGDFLLSLLSPRVIFSVLVGLGATGLFAREWLGGLLLFAVALAGGLAFEKLLVGPFWNFLFRFASQPALTLESALMDTATAVTGFDRNGQGLVSIELDGQVVQLLATLRPEDRAKGVRVHAGDALLIEEVDGARNRCTVSWTGTTAIPAGR
ncbi:MAG TPA: hypothetical protein VF746_27405 [Longimicrobium sp.]|jgi:hypothetical protein